MTNILIKSIASILLIYILLQNTVMADVCSITEGTYVGKARTDEKEKRPLFIVVDNGHIAGFYAPEDQTHPQGAAINQTEQVSAFNFFVTTTSKGAFLNFKVPGALEGTFPIGKAKLIMAQGGVAFKGYYSPDEDSFSSDFINVGRDGGIVARVTSGMNFNFFFGKANQAGEFVQIFPEKGNEPKLSLDFFGIELDADVTFDGKTSRVVFERTSDASCTTGDTSAEGALANAALIQAFNSNLSDLETTLIGLFEAVDKKFKKEESTLNSIDVLSLIIKNRPPKPCKIQITHGLNTLGKFIAQIENSLCSINNEPKCLPDDIAASFITSSRAALDRLREGFNIDDDNNGVPDLCQKPTDAGDTD